MWGRIFLKKPRTLSLRQDMGSALEIRNYYTIHLYCIIIKVMLMKKLQSGGRNLLQYIFIHLSILTSLLIISIIILDHESVTYTYSWYSMLYDSGRAIKSQNLL